MLTLRQVLTMILGGSTNAVLHLTAMAHAAGIELTLDDYQSVSDRVPFMEDVYKIGGIPSPCSHHAQRVGGVDPPVEHQRSSRTS
jgi:dihydroxyacid dehydratase/phosphogluconate dehydratase